MSPAATAADRAGTYHLIGVHVGEMLSAARRRRGVSQAHLAGHLGTSEAAIGRWERAERTMTVPRLRALCAPLRLDIAAVLTEATHISATERPQPPHHACATAAEASQ